MASNTAVTAKVVVSNVSESSDGQRVVTLYADYADNRNKEWAKYTPAISLSITVKDEVADHFPAGQAFLLTFSPEDAPTTPPDASGAPKGTLG